MVVGSFDTDFDFDFALLFFYFSYFAQFVVSISWTLDYRTLISEIIRKDWDI